MPISRTEGVEWLCQRILYRSLITVGVPSLFKSRIIHKLRGKYRIAGREICITIFKCRQDCFRQSVPIKIMSRDDTVQVEIVFHPAIEHTFLNNSLKLLGNNRFQ